jgi:hypothetical protein
MLIIIECDYQVLCSHREILESDIEEQPLTNEKLSGDVLSNIQSQEFIRIHLASIKIPG